MNIIQSNDLTLMNYIVKVKDGTVTKNDREKVRNIVNNFELYLAVFNDIIYIAKSSVIEETLTIDNAFNLVKTEYELLEFDNFIPFKYLEHVVYLSINILHVNSMTNEEFWDKIIATIDVMQQCLDPKLVHDMYYFMITLINSYRVAVSNLEVTKQILTKINSYQDEVVEITLLPPYLIGF